MKRYLTQSLEQRSRDDNHAARPFIPTRLIDLGLRDQGQPPRLIITSDIEDINFATGLKYAALSYCWGPPADAKSQFKTEKDTLSTRLRSIDMNSVTPVIKDAAKVCDALGIRYLWVDAVCIVQHDITDWSQESQKMMDVYATAAVTICNLVSNTCQEGFINTRPNDAISLPFSSKINHSITGHYTIRYGKVFSARDSFESYGDYHLQDDIDSTWSTRAWTYQELIGSRLALKFGRRKVHLLTPEGTKSEASDRSEPSRLLLIDRINQIREDRFSNVMDDIYRLWVTGVVPDFSNLVLTYAADRFPALSGLAAHCQRILNDKYVAGMWEGDLFRQLFWSAGPTFKTLDDLVASLHSPKPYIAPSWSWARKQSFAENGFLFMHLYSFDNIYEREYTSIQSFIRQHDRIKDPFGQIDGASLTIVSRVLPLPAPPERFQRKGFTKSFWKAKDIHGEYLAICSFDWDYQAAEQTPTLQLLLLGSEVEKTHPRYYEDEDESDETSEDESNGEEEGDDDDTNSGEDANEDVDEDVDDEHWSQDDDELLTESDRRVWGLIICHTDGSYKAFGSGEYYRVGVFYSVPKGQGGLKLFYGCELRTVCVI